MKATTLPFLTLAVVASLLSLVNSQSLISSSVPDAVTHIAVSANGVFVSTDTHIYNFSSTLQQLGALGFHGGVIKGIASTSDGESCVVCTEECGLNLYLTCSVLKGSNLSSLSMKGTASRSRSSLVLFTATGGDGSSFYMGSYVNHHILYHQYGFPGNALSRATDRLHQLSVSNFHRIFVKGFFGSGFAYYVTIDPLIRGTTKQIRIIRVCNESAANDFNNQYELTLGCDGQDSFFNPTLLDVSIIGEELLLIAIKTGSSVDVCSYTLSEINSLMDNAYESCVISGTGNKNILWQQSVSCSKKLSGSICSISDSRSRNPAPAIGVSNTLSPNRLITNGTILKGLTAITGVRMEDVNFIYLAFVTDSINYISKYQWTNKDLKFLKEVNVTSAISSLSWSEGSEYVYGISGSNVIALKVEDCSSATSCSECVSLGDPSCGWCMIENKCSRRPFCMDNNETRRYLTQGDSNSCINAIHIYQTPYVIDTHQQPHQINLYFSPPPMLPGEQYFCVFNGIMSPMEVSINSNISSCSVQAIVSKVIDIQLDTTFSIYSNRTGVHFYTSPANIAFYNCPVATRCSECVKSKVCGWCELDFTCTGSNSSCTAGSWLRISNTDSDICPFLQPNPLKSDGRYTQPAKVVKNLELSTTNTQFKTGLSYECIYGTDTRTATVNNDNTVTCINDPVLIIEGGGTQNVPLSLRQVYNGNKYTIETNYDSKLSVILYDCPLLAAGCSSCLSQSTSAGFNCSWCTSSNECRDISDCNDISPITSTRNCPLPVITDFNPKAGPPSGGTIVTVSGNSLGTELSDIETVRIGNKNCRISEYRPAEKRITCIIATINETRDSNETVAVSLRRSNGIIAITSSSLQFQFMTPTVESVSPTYGPVSGGTKVIIKGTNLDIGNKEMTRVIMKKDQKTKNTCPDVHCTVLSITHTEITCITAGTSVYDDCMRNVMISINGASFSNNAIKYQYRPDPTINSVTPMNTIPAGGIQLIFTGSNFDSVQSPAITINDSRLTPSSIESCVTYDANTLICNAPKITNVTDSSYYGTHIEYKLMLDGAESLNSMSTDLRLTLQPDPIFTGIDINSRSISVDDSKRTLDDSDIADITIEGMNIRSVSHSEIAITFGDDMCIVRSSSDTEINCTPPDKPSGTTLALRIRVGRNLVFPPTGTNGSEWILHYTASGATVESIESESRSTSVNAIAGGAIIIVIILIVAILLILAIRVLKMRLYINNMKERYENSDQNDEEIGQKDQLNKQDQETQAINETTQK